MASTKADSELIAKELPMTDDVCVNYAKPMAAAEKAGLCDQFVKSAMVFESGGPPIKAAETIGSCKPEVAAEPVPPKPPTPAATTPAAETPVANADVQTFAIQDQPKIEVRELPASPVVDAPVVVTPTPQVVAAPVAPVPEVKNELVSLELGGDVQAVGDSALPLDSAKKLYNNSSTYDKAQEFLKSNGNASPGLDKYLKSDVHKEALKVIKNPKIKFHNVPDSKIYFQFDNSHSYNDLKPKDRDDSPWWKKTFTKTMEIIFPTAQAGMMDMALMGIGTQMASGFISKTLDSLAVMVDAQMLIPKRRAIIWLAMGALATAAAMATASEKDKVQSNIDGIDKVLNEMTKLKSGNKTDVAVKVKNQLIGSSSVNKNAISINGANNGEINFGGNGQSTLPCFTGDSASSCPSFSEQLSSMPRPLNMPDFVQTQIDGIGKLTDGLNGTGRISGSTLGQSRNIAGQANALRAQVSKLQLGLETKLNSRGGNSDLSKAGSNFRSDLDNLVQRQLNSRNASASGMLASFGSSRGGFGGSGGGFGGSNGSGSSGGSGSSATDASKNAFKKRIFNPLSPNSSSGSGSSSSDFSYHKSGDGELSAEEKAKQDADEAAKAAALAENGGKKATMDDYVLSNDITQDKDTSIFQIITQRYMKSYDRLFEVAK